MTQQTQAPATRNVSNTLAADLAAEAVRESLAQVVATINGREYTRLQLRCAFDLVANPENWKRAVKTTVRASQIDAVGGWLVLREAVIFFTGSIPRAAAVPNAVVSSFVVTAAGYYAAVGA